MEPLDLFYCMWTSDATSDFVSLNFGIRFSDTEDHICIYKILFYWF